MDVSAVIDDAVRWRRHLHRHPELSFEEYATADFIGDTLASFDALEIERPTKTSVMARLVGGRPGKTLALRADIDALPIQEETGLPFASEVKGVMHACGHDGHTAMLLAVTRLLSLQRRDLSGEVRFLFQHAEEKPPGGAAELVAAGVLDGVDAIFGCHLQSTIELGRVAALDGALMAGGGTFEVTIKGRGGHAGIPQESIDPITTAAEAVTSLQHVVSRNSSPLDNVVVSITRITGGDADNVIPDAVVLGGTVRTFDEEVRERTLKAMDRVLRGVTKAHGATVKFRYVGAYDPVINDPELARLVRETAAERTIKIDPMMAGDDFSAYLRAAPGCYFFVGAGGAGAFPHHHPKFTINEDALTVGIDTLTHLATKFLS